MNRREDIQPTISMNQLTSWGLRRHVLMEQIKDIHLQEIAEPSKDAKNEIIKEWFKIKQINSKLTTK